MQEQLKSLIEYQILEDRKAGVLQGFEETPRRIAAIEKEFGRLEGEFFSIKTEYDNARKMHGALEQGIADLEAKIARSKRRMSEVKTNKEYQAMAREIDEYKKEISQKEDKALELMTEVETLAGKVAEMEKEVEKQRSIVAEDKRLLETETSVLKERLDRLEVAQSKVRDRMDKNIQKKTEFLLQRQAGVAVAAVDNGVCSKCHLNMPPQKFIELQKDENLMQCPHCHRFVYYSGHECYQFVIDDLDESM